MARTPQIQNSTNRVLRCFCNCTELTREDVKNMVMMTPSGFVENSLAKKLFRSFMKIEHRTDCSGSAALSALDCYELCDIMLINPINRTEDNFEKLIELCPSYQLEKELTRTIEQLDTDEQQFGKSLENLMFECLRIIQCHRDYQNFHERLKKKL